MNAVNYAKVLVENQLTGTTLSQLTAENFNKYHSPCPWWHFPIRGVHNVQLQTSILAKASELKTIRYRGMLRRLRLP